MLAEAAEWLLQAEDAFKAADAMYLTRRYLYAIFMCQLAIEKGLKAVVVARTGRLAPKTHNLTYLAELGQARLTEEQREFMAVLDAAGTTTRYPKDLRAAMKGYPRRVVMQYLSKTREVLECIKKDPALSRS